MEFSSREIQDSKRVFNIQKEIIRIMVMLKKVSCTEVFKKFNILPLGGEFFLSLLQFTVENTEKFQTN
jgi:hypothetical protein